MPGYEFMSLPLPCISFAIRNKLRCWISSIYFMGVGACARKHTQPHTHTHTPSTHPHTHTLTPTPTDTHTLTHTLPPTHTHPHPPIHTHTHTHTHTHKLDFGFVRFSSVRLEKCSGSTSIKPRSLSFRMLYNSPFNTHLISTEHSLRYCENC
jgi:hypothetical protein